MMINPLAMASTKERGNMKKVLLRQRTCDGGARVCVDQSVRQGTYNDGIGIGFGVIEAKGIYY
jgi:hypothetical protein